MSYFARQALKRATLHRIRMHAGSATNTARYASTSSSKSSGRSSSTATAVIGLGAAAAGAPSGGAGGGSGGGGGNGGPGRGPGKGWTGGSGYDGEEQEEEGEEEEEEEEAEGEEEEAARLRRKRKGKGRAKEKPAKRRRQNKDDEDYRPSSTPTTSSSGSRQPTRSSLRGLGPILPPRSPPTPHIPGEYHDPPYPLPTAPGTDEAVSPHHRADADPPSTAGSSSSDPLGYHSSPSAAAAIAAANRAQNRDAPSSDTSDDPLHLGPAVVRPRAVDRNEPLDRDFDNQFGAHAQDAARPAPAQPATQRQQRQQQQQQQQPPASAQGQVVEGRGPRWDDGLTYEQRAAAIEEKLREVAEMEAAQRRYEEEGEDRGEGGSS